MIAVFACAAISFSFVHLFCAGLLPRRTRSTPLFLELFRKNDRRAGYALRSSYLMPHAGKPEALQGMPQHESLYRLVRFTAHGALVFAAASIVTELWLLLKVVG
jgi:hypothetical protein